MIIETQDGSHSIFSNEFGVPYHSKYGAIQETDHVFIKAGLRLKAVLQDKLTILDIGFGTGLNALMTYLEAEKRGLSIDYVALEAFPIAMSTVQQLNYPAILKLEPSVFYQLHESSWNQPTKLAANFQLTKLKCLFQEIAFDNYFDVIYYDAFAPNAQPELWEQPLLQKMYDALKPDGILVTYCAKGSFKRTLKAIGFTVERLPGPPGKREMTRGVK